MLSGFRGSPTALKKKSGFAATFLNPPGGSRGRGGEGGGIWGGGGGRGAPTLGLFSGRGRSDRDNDKQ